MPEDAARFVVRFSGLVQGVGFRATTISVADGLDVNGFVRNEPDGTVLLDIDGPPDVIEELIGRIRRAMSQRIQDVVIDRHASLGRSEGLHIRA